MVLILWYVLYNSRVFFLLTRGLRLVLGFKEGTQTGPGFNQKSDQCAFEVKVGIFCRVLR